MKLSFSTNYWKDYSFEQFVGYAVEYKFDGIEIHDIKSLADALKPEKSPDLTTSWRENGLCVPCIDATGDIADPSCAEDTEKEILACISVAKNYMRRIFGCVRSAATVPSSWFEAFAGGGKRPASSF